jgi:hypothetical protein
VTGRGRQGRVAMCGHGGSAGRWFDKGWHGGQLGSGEAGGLGSAAAWMAGGAPPACVVQLWCGLSGGVPPADASILPRACN